MLDKSIEVLIILNSIAFKIGQNNHFFQNYYLNQQIFQKLLIVTYQTLYFLKTTGQDLSESFERSI